MSKSNLFTEVKVLDTSYNTFDLSHDRKQSFNMGRLVPCCLIETLPGDKFHVKGNHLIRLAPMVAPMMHTVNVFMHYFYVPTRLVWSGLPDFVANTGGTDGGAVPVYPFVDLAAVGKVRQSSIGDYLGLPTAVEFGPEPQVYKVSAIPFAAIALIWDEFYRDQNLQDKLGIVLNDGDNTSLITAANLIQGNPLERAWTQDYQTSCLPFVQKGETVRIPLGTTADIEFIGGIPSTLHIQTGAGGGVGAVAPSGDVKYDNLTGLQVDPASSGPVIVNVDNSPSLKADLTTALAASINDLRLAFKLQQYFELSARTGTRYTEYLRGHWGVRSSDRSLQRPVYLGGSKSPLVISEVLQTSETTEQSPQATMSGHAYSASNANQFHYECEEHGYIVGFISVMPKPAYMNNMQKHWFRLDKYDFYHPVFANLGEQAVQNREVYCSGYVNDDSETFGYQARWAEYKDIPSSVHGMFRSELDFWHMARDFETAPALNSAFISCADATQRIFAVQGTEENPIDQIWSHIVNEIKVGRKMPMFGIPQIV